MDAILMPTTSCSAKSLGNLLMCWKSIIRYVASTGAISKLVQLFYSLMYTSNACEFVFLQDEMTNENWQLIRRLKKQFGIL